jgi:DNA invertase Pin-like site-specific DNA recombinase
MMSEKIQPAHRERVACVYVRQSTMTQVRHNRESRQRQYGLADRAKGLGFSRVRVIDDDLGRSGSGTQERPGFARLVASVCAGEAGAVLAIEASRLARNNRDWHHLIDLCAMTSTLLIDHDGVYDPSLLNDRLLLGLKGTMSEFELNLLRQRSQESLRRMIGRGEVLSQVAIGYVRTECNGIEMTPDLRVQTAIHGLFAKFHETGSVRQTLLWYRQNQIPLPTWSAASGNREVAWQLPVYNRIHSILKNPVYAGTFVHGRRRTQTVVVDGRARKTRGHEVPLAQWDVVIHDHHEAYIDWSTFLANREQIQTNIGERGRAGAGAGAAKAGPALLAGLLRCGRCGRKLHVGYSGKGGRVPRYFCRGAHLNHGTDWCISFGGLRADEAVTQQVLQTLAGSGVEASLAAWSRFKQQEDERSRALEMALQQARYESQRARKQYDAVDPGNRLVASELERRWNTSLTKVVELESGLDDLQAGREEIGEPQRLRLLVLGQDLRRLWGHPATTAALKKRLLRTVLEEIVVNTSKDPPRIHLRLHWSGGVHTDLTIAKNATGHHKHCTDRNVIELARQLAKVCDDKTIASVLNRLGYRTGHGNTWTLTRIKTMRSHHGIPPLNTDKTRLWVTLEQAARELNVSRHAVRILIRRGILPAQQVVRYAPWVIERADLQCEPVQKVIQAIQSGQQLPRREIPDSQPVLFQQGSEV